MKFNEFIRLEHTFLLLFLIFIYDYNITSKPEIKDRVHIALISNVDRGFVREYYLTETATSNLNLINFNKDFEAYFENKIYQIRNNKVNLKINYQTNPVRKFSDLFAINYHKIYFFENSISKDQEEYITKIVENFLNQSNFYQSVTYKIFIINA